MMQAARSNSSANVQAGLRKRISVIDEYASSGRDFYSGKSFETAVHEAVYANHKLGAQSAAMMRQIDAGAIAKPRKRRIRSYAGGRVSIPAYIAGSPKAMRRRKKLPDVTAPLTIIVNGSSSGTESASDLEKRGIAIAALVKKLSIVRPVSFYLMLSSQVGMSKREEEVSTYALIKFPSAPLDLTRASHLLSDQGWNRGLGFCATIAMSGQYAKLIGQTTTSRYSEHGVYWPFRAMRFDIRKPIKAVFPGDILYIDGAKLGDPDFDACKRDHVAWINAKVAEFST